MLTFFHRCLGCCHQFIDTCLLHSYTGIPNLASVGRGLGGSPKLRGPRQKSLASVRVSLPTFAFVLTRSPVFPFVMPGLDPGIHVKSTPAQRTPPALAGGSSAWTTGIGVRRTPFCERLCPVVTSQRPWLAMARALRCAARTRFRASLRAQRSNPVSGAALDCFVAFAPRNDEGAAMRRENEIFSPPAHVRAARGGEGLGVGGTSVRPPPRLISLT